MNSFVSLKTQNSLKLRCDFILF